MSKQYKVGIFLILSTLLINVTLSQTPASKKISLDYNTLTWVSQTEAYLVTTDQSLYQTLDTGATFNPLSYMGKPVNVRNFFIDNINEDYLLAVSSISNNNQITFYRSTDGGSSFVVITQQLALNNIKINPKVSGHILATDTTKNLYVSTDFAMTWKKILSGTKVNQFAWDPSVDNTSPDGFFAITVSKGTSQLIYSNDFGTTIKTMLPGAQSIETTANYLYIGVFYNAESILYVRSNSNPYQNDIMGLLECDFPFGEEIQPNQYSVVDDSTGAIWLGVNITQDRPSNPFSGVYVSNGIGNVFTLSAPYVTHVYSPTNKDDNYDFTPFFGLPGVYVINNVTNPYQPGKGAFINTLITYNNGGKWQTLTPPANSGKTGTLNVFGLTTFSGKGYGPFYTNNNVPGFALASGAVNQGISVNAPVQNINTYLTRDGGLTWAQIYDNPAIYEYINYGSIIVLADAASNTDTIKYSLDQGTTWTDYKFILDGSKYDIENIITDPNTSSVKAILIATDVNNNGVLFSIDFTQVLPNACTTDDMETYVTGEILGATWTYTRRKQASVCSISAPPPSPTSSSATCTYDDFECDLGYIEFSSNDGTLVCGTDPDFIPPNNWQEDPPENCPDGSTYTITKGFRLVASDLCSGGVSDDLSPIVKNCPSTFFKKSHGWVAALVIILLLVVGGIGGVLYLRKNPDVKEKILKKIGLSKDTKYSSLSFRPNSLADDEFGIEDDDAQILNDNDLNDTF